MPPRPEPTLTAALLCALALGPSAARAQQAPDAAVGAAHRAFFGINEQHLLDELRSGRIVNRTQVGSTSINYHLRLSGDVDAGFKPRSRLMGSSYLSEIAAWRLNRLLGLQRVPPAVYRVIPAPQLRLPPDTPVVVERDGSVRGAAVYWVPVLQDSRIDQDHERERWRAWLSQRTPVPPDQAARAEEISTLILFDFLIGNGDRWSGSNVPMDGAGHLIYRDNNQGFLEPATDATLQSLMLQLRRVQRFSRGVVERVRNLTEAQLRAEFANEVDPTVPLLSPPQLTSLMRRRDTLVAYLDDLVHRYGEAAVLPFP